jgi:hypothetical protein
MILVDHNPSDVYKLENSYSTIIYLPYDTCVGTVTYCGFDYPDVNVAKADVDRNGVVDTNDVQIAAMAFGCSGSCLDLGSNYTHCYFEDSKVRFVDPFPVDKPDCFVNMMDLNQILSTSWFGKIVDNSTAKYDINKDGSINAADLSMLATYFGEYANHYEKYDGVPNRNADFDANGIVQMDDIFAITKKLNQKASVQVCKNKPLTSLGGNQFKVDVSGRDLFYVSASYKCVEIG